IEMQVFHTTAFEKRVLYYVSKAYYQQLDRSEEYPKLNQVIFLGFLDFNLFKQNPHYCTRHLILEEKSNEHHFQDFELNFVELPKFKKALGELKDIKDKWIYFVQNAENMKMIPIELQEPKELKEAFEVANQMTWTKKELEAYDARGIYIQDERGRIEYAMEEGERVGMEKGEKIGLKKGEKIGLEKGKFEEKQSIARAMLKEGMKPEAVARLTGLTIDDI
ncbi:MAG: hypothetical protein QG657_2162, partial [Acidobacteriota bacterium]|nr:hypothetical protein [Acidobacteriota bacterium]